MTTAERSRSSPSRKVPRSIAKDGSDIYRESALVNWLHPCGGRDEEVHDPPNVLARPLPGSPPAPSRGQGSSGAQLSRKLSRIGIQGESGIAVSTRASVHSRCVSNLGF